jgi:hypothetical protein
VKLVGGLDVDARRVEATAAKYDALAPGGRVGRFTAYQEMLDSAPWTPS